MKFTELDPSDITCDVCKKCASTSINCCELPLQLPGPVDPDHKELLQRQIENYPELTFRELPYHPNGGELVLTCSHLKNGQCDIYEDRPKSCKEFNCVSWTRATGNPIHYNKVLKIKKEMDLL